MTVNVTSSRVGTRTTLTFKFAASTSSQPGILRSLVNLHIRLDAGQRFIICFDFNDIIGFDQKRSDIDPAAIDRYVIVRNDLTAIGTGLGKPAVKKNAVQTAFQKLQKDMAGDTLGAHRFQKVITELSFQNAVNTLDLLFLTQLNTKVGKFALFSNHAGPERIHDGTPRIYAYNNAYLSKKASRLHGGKDDNLVLNHAPYFLISFP